MIRWLDDMELTAKSFAKKNLWRVKGLGYEYNDLLHDAYLLFDDCLKKYHHLRPKHFRNLYRKSLKNMCNKLSNNVTDKFIHTAELDNENIFPIDQVVDNGIEEEINFRLRFANAPKEVRQAIQLMVNPPEELLELFREKRYSKAFKNNRMLCKILGIKDFNKQNIVTDVKEFLRGG